MMSIDVLFKDHIEAAIEFEPKLLPQVSKNLCVYASANKGESINKVIFLFQSDSINYLEFQFLADFITIVQD